MKNKQNQSTNRDTTNAVNTVAVNNQIKGNNHGGRYNNSNKPNDNKSSGNKPTQNAAHNSQSTNNQAVDNNMAKGNIPYGKPTTNSNKSNTDKLIVNTSNADKPRTGKGNVNTPNANKSSTGKPSVDKGNNGLKGNKSKGGKSVNNLTTTLASSNNNNKGTNQQRNPEHRAGNDNNTNHINASNPINNSSVDDRSINVDSSPKKGSNRHVDTKGRLKIAFLGGLGEIGKNMMLFEYEQDIVIVDCGVSFPTGDMPGVDLVIPDITYLKENQHKLHGLLLTHGHEDHIGAVPFIVKDIANESKLDIYGSKLTLALVDNKLIEHNCMDKVERHIVDDSQVIRLGVFEIEFLRVTHSVAGSLAIVIKTPVGKVFLTGDFKIDHTPIHSPPMNLARIAQLGDEGIQLLLCDSTNVEVEGYTLSERCVSQQLAEIFADNVGKRIIVATFSSNVDRVQEVFQLAIKYNRKVAISGRSMANTIETASNAGYMSYDKSIIVPNNQIEKVDDGNLVILSTGSQGEPFSALTRMASGEFNKVKITSNDTIVISASPIPGNEKDINRVINNLFRLGANVIYNQIQAVHVSGHAHVEELKLLHALVKPKFFVPVHGEYRHLVIHRNLAMSMGMKDKNILIAENGDLVELSSKGIAIKGKVPSGNVYIDGLGVGDVGSEILHDRLALSEDGIIIVVCGVENGTVTARPQVFSRGCLYAGNQRTEQTIEEIKDIAMGVLANADLIKLDLQSIKTAITKQIRSYYRKTYQRFPMVIAIVMSSALDERES
ncbi:MAG: RNase J family beta-CASP ribonuclease [Clostridia bacterium]|nr:RNase J family beta-CASP ribonuclease [Clostridia bacterium]